MALGKSLRRICAIALALAFVGVIVILGCLWAFGRRDDSTGWGRGRFKVSEAAYYVARISRIPQQWAELARRADQSSDGRLKQPYSVYLVIDTAAGAIWIEEAGVVAPEPRCELPRGLTWRVYHCGPEGLKELSGPVRLQFRGVRLAQYWPEALHLVGQRGVSEHLSFLIGCRVGLNGEHGKGRFVPRVTPYTIKYGPDYYYKSILVSDAEYEERQRSWSSAESEDAADHPKQATIVGREIAAWSKVEKKLYQTIESQVNKMGFNLYELKVEPGPGWSAAHAHVYASSDDVWHRLFGRRQHGTAYLKIDHLGDGLWYAGTAPHGFSGGITVLELEFIVSGDGSLSQEELSRGLAQGREKQNPTTPPASPWRATLPNGATVAILGISKVTDGERHWWGPDGNTATSVPEFYSQSQPDDSQLAIRYEIVWLVDWLLPSAGATFFSWAIQSSQSFNPPHLGGGPANDRYGERYWQSSEMDTIGTTRSLGGGVMRCFYAGGILCREPDTQMTLSLGLRSDRGNVEWVTFRNISLRPGENPGFQIVPGEGDTR